MTTHAALFEDILQRGHTLQVQVTGRSMAPFLRSGELVTIRPVPPETVRIGDLVFMKTPQGGLILHRLIKKMFTPQGIMFQTKGDASAHLDQPLPVQNLLGKVCQIEKRAQGKSSITRVNLEERHWQWRNYLIARTHVYALRLRSIWHRFIVPIWQ